MTQVTMETLEPTVLYRMDPEHDRQSTATVPTAYGEALIVFRGPEDAQGYQRTTGKHTDEEGFKPVSLSGEEISGVLDIHGLSVVAMPEPWTGEASSGVDVFSRDNFFRFLEECALASPASPA
jgi:hypothetical protein